MRYACDLPSNNIFLANIVQGIIAKARARGELPTGGRFVTEQDLMIVASENVALCGILTMDLIGKFQDLESAWITTLYVEPQWRRRGIGRRLMEDALLAAKERGCRQVLLGTGTDNGRMRALSTSLAFATHHVVLARKL